MGSIKHIYVSKGSFSSPYYNFYLDSAGVQELSTLNSSYTYIFHRLNEEISHPFYIGDSGYKNNSSN